MNKYLKIKTIGLIFFICLVQTSLLCSQGNQFERIEISSSPNPVGSGARALGMGGAFIAVADDATSASWNPGGLIQLEFSEISLVLGQINRKEGNYFSNHPEANSTETSNDFHINYFSMAYPFVMNGHNAIFSINYQHLYSFKRQWDFDFNHPNPQFEWPMKIDFEQDGSLFALGIAFCTEITPELTVGITFNIWDDFLYDNEWEQKQNIDGEIIGNGAKGSYNIFAQDKYSHQGINANLGLLWRITSKWTLAGVIKLPFKANIDHQMHVNINTVYYQNTGTDVHTVENETYEEHLYMPLSYGIGLMYRLSDNFTISGDLYRTHWDGFKYENRHGQKTSPISGMDMDASDIDPTTWFRIGAEYIKIGKQFAIPFRAGLFYDPAPSEGSPDSYYGFSLGSGLGFKNYIFDIAYQFRTGNDAGDSMLKNLNFSQDIREHTLYASMIYHFY